MSGRRWRQDAWASVTPTSASCPMGHVASTVSRSPDCLPHRKYDPPLHAVSVGAPSLTGHAVFPNGLAIICFSRGQSVMSPPRVRIQEPLLYFCRVLWPFMTSPSSLYGCKEGTKAGPRGAFTEERPRKSGIAGTRKLSGTLDQPLRRTNGTRDTHYGSRELHFCRLLRANASRRSGNSPGPIEMARTRLSR